MALHITNPETEKNVRALAALTGEPIAEAVNKAAVERLRGLAVGRNDPQMMDDLYAILGEFDGLPLMDGRSAEEILGYDENGLPT